MKILMIPSFFKNIEITTLGSFFLDQAIALQKRGHNVIIIYPDVYSIKYLNKFIKYCEKNEIISNVKIYRVKKFSLTKHGNKGCNKQFVRGCIEIFDELYNNGLRFDIIHAQNCVWAGYAALQLSKKYKIPYVITEHSSLFGYSKNEIDMNMKKKIIAAFRGASQVISVSEALRRDIKPYIENVKIIGNIVDTNSYRPLHLKNSRKSFRFIVVAYLTIEERVKLKGIDVIIHAMNILIKKGMTNIECLIVGVPKDFSYISNIVESLSLQNYIKIRPPLSRDEIVMEMNSSDCFVMPSQYETFGLVYAEAMATGLPIIGTDVGIVSEIVTPDTGMICEKNNAELLANSMTYIIDHKDEYSTNFCYQNIVERYSEDSICTKIEEIYRQVLSK